MKIRDAILAEALPLAPIPHDLMYQYVVAGNGLFIRAEDSRIEAMVPVAYAHNHGLEKVDPYAKLKVPRASSSFLHAIYHSARRHLPLEAMYQMTWECGAWHCAMPASIASHAALEFEDRPEAIIDIHSHGNLYAFFSETDDHDEQGLRFYVVVGDVGGNVPQIACRVGVYGHHWQVTPMTLFEGAHIFTQVDPDVEIVLAENDNENTNPETD